MESYWRAILREVQNKDNEDFGFRYTNVGPDEEITRPKRDSQKPKEKPKKFVVGEPYPAVYFTQREFDCMVSLLRGRTVKQIAGILGLSPRTVEYYIKNLKSKLGSESRSELLDSAMRTDLIKKVLSGDEGVESAESATSLPTDE